eukprot:9213724-Alexandrium_andersonii.AAC.1
MKHGFLHTSRASRRADVRCAARGRGLCSTDSEQLSLEPNTTAAQGSNRDRAGSPCAWCRQGAQPQ